LLGTGTDVITSINFSNPNEIKKNADKLEKLIQADESELASLKSSYKASVQNLRKVYDLEIQKRVAEVMSRVEESVKSLDPVAAQKKREDAKKVMDKRVDAAKQQLDKDIQDYSKEFNAQVNRADGYLKGAKDIISQAKASKETKENPGLILLKNLGEAAAIMAAVEGVVFVAPVAWKAIRNKIVKIDENYKVNKEYSQAMKEAAKAKALSGRGSREAKDIVAKRLKAAMKAKEATGKSSKSAEDLLKDLSTKKPKVIKPKKTIDPASKPGETQLDKK
ncbi:MAG: hypothetical protein NTY68_02265, partial [Candidatus Micrarchaeota archaeon]|nr:hypothetical protein [Candidatus Micrarchaeota archaeon]